MSAIGELWDSIVGFGFSYFERPYVLLVILPIILFLLYFIRKEFVKLHVPKELEAKKKFVRKFVLLSRIFVVVLLLVALASPYVETLKTVKGDPRVKILIDNSTSMELFDMSVANNLYSELEKRLPVEIAYVAGGEESRLGDEILANMRKDDNLLLVSDGNNNHGLELADVVLQANTINVSISGVYLSANEFDASVSILGPDKTTSNVDNEFIVRIRKTEPRDSRLTVKIDNNIVFDQVTGEDEIRFKRSFANGYHRIYARIADPDYFSQNNEFFKTVKVVPKPRVLLVTSNSELGELFNPLYELDVVSEVPADLSPYTAVILDDIHSENLNERTEILVDYIVEGNGLFAVGGKNSYDFGDYNKSRFEQLLPVFVAKAGRQRGDINIVFVMDISQSTGEGFGGYTKVDVEKALAIGMLNNISFSNNVGFVAFNTLAYVVADLRPLLEHENLEAQIMAMRFGSGTNIENGLLAAIDMLQNSGGSKNIILISDGRNNLGTTGVIDVANYASSLGVRIYTVGVGGDTFTEFLTEVADITNAAYFQPDTTQQIRLLFGDIEVSADKKVFPLNIVDDNHFITQGLDLNAKLYGFNQIVPKDSAKMLITTDVGDPVLAVWRFGLGRVASLGSDVRTFGFELLNKDNSMLLTRTTNWVVGDPERKNERFIDIPDGRIEEPIAITIRSDVQPSSDRVALYKIDDNLYSGSIAVKEPGFNEVLNAVFAANYKREYQEIGFNENFNSIVSATGGRMFDADNIEGITEFIKQRSRREILAKDSYSWIFLLAALIIYLAEVCLRRLVAYKII